MYLCIYVYIYVSMYLCIYVYIDPKCQTVCGYRWCETWQTGSPRTPQYIDG